uniref:Uncharacterized protein n=1 Tax=Setaria italica TaxID=4555 RepID=K3ZCC7_SETIT
MLLLSTAFHSSVLVLPRSTDPSALAANGDPAHLSTTSSTKPAKSARFLSCEMNALASIISLMNLLSKRAMPCSSTVPMS